jgi:Rad3-related DNA helicase
MIRALRPHQQFALDALRSSLVGGKRRPMLAMPTGGGKTLLAAAIVEGALKRGKRVCFVVPALSLIDQTLQAFWNEGIRDVGVIQGYHLETDWSRPVQVASIQTLQRRGYSRQPFANLHRYKLRYSRLIPPEARNRKARRVAYRRAFCVSVVLRSPGRCVFFAIANWCAVLQNLFHGQRLLIAPSLGVSSQTWPLAIAGGFFLDTSSRAPRGEGP